MQKYIAYMNPIQPASASRPEATVPFHRSFLRRQSVPGLPSPAHDKQPDLKPQNTLDFGSKFDHWIHGHVIAVWCTILRVPLMS